MIAASFRVTKLYLWELGQYNCISGLENRDYGRWGFVALTTRHPSIRKSWQ
jgi:hypothetical protein